MAVLIEATPHLLRLEPLQRYPVCTNWLSKRIRMRLSNDQWPRQTLLIQAEACSSS